MAKILSAAIVGLFLVLCSISVVGQVTPPAPSQPTQAQQITPEKRAQILELLEVMKIAESSKQLFEAMSEQLAKQRVEITWEYLKDTPLLTPEEQAKLRDEIAASQERASKRFQERLFQRIDFGQMMQEISMEVYARHYTETEVQDLVNFYKSPTGKKTLEIMPAIVGEAMSRASERFLPVIKEISRELAKEEAVSYQKRVDDIVKSHHRATTRSRGQKKG